MYLEWRVFCPDSGKRSGLAFLLWNREVLTTNKIALLGPPFSILVAFPSWKRDTYPECHLDAGIGKQAAV